ncbi:hypothetical protein [Sphingosinicella sp. BN140058]|uniref:hypothetical protein n=1 Tax=Sphingosinicella sp. BN140058 TaxID=1892855 RepID=UPI00101152E5|nr:hypothetical protein [Sphingosinicella sp. BN140058]QAY77629.1 hypothetical protein ETR14_14755 [Sphingosinicella sp. BN140058]
MVGSLRGASVALAALAAALPVQAVERAERYQAAWSLARCVSAAAEQEGGSAPARPFQLKEFNYDTRLRADTANAQAQAWFQQGLRLIWAYDEAEAIRNFREAQRLDPDCAMCHWGEALARSPTLNLQPPYVDVDAAAAAARRAAARAGRLGPRDRGLINAILIRAPATGTAFDNEGYVRAMAALAEQFPQEDAVLVLASDAQIVRWAAGGAPLQQAQSWLETVLRRDPQNKAAIHFYIHLSDIVDKPALPLPFAGTLADSGAGASHLVHMASHTFYNKGRFADAVTANRKAIDLYGEYEKQAPAFSAYRRYLYAHDHHYAIEAAMMRGDGRNAIEVADLFNERFPAKDPLFRIRAAHYAAPYFAYGRHAPVQTVLALRGPATGWSGDVYALAAAAWHYARGEAFARNGDAAGVTTEARAIATLRDGPDGRALGPEGAALATISQRVLEGRAAMLRSDYASAITAYRAAMTEQGNAGLQFDPPPFWYGVRRSLAAAMLKAGDAEGAKRQLLASLAMFQEDGIALWTLGLAEIQLGNPDAGKAYQARAQRAWAGESLERMPIALF